MGEWVVLVVWVVLVEVLGVVLVEVFEGKVGLVFLALLALGLALCDGIARPEQTVELASVSVDPGSGSTRDESWMAQLEVVASDFAVWVGLPRGGMA